MFNINPSKKSLEQRVVGDMMDNRFSRYEVKVNQIIHGGDAERLLRQYRSRLVCPKCAGIMAFEGKNKGYCPRCHYQGESITMSQFMQNKMYR